MNAPYHAGYVAGSFLAALVAAVGIYVESPVLYGIVPGIVGGALAAVATVRFLRDKVDLAGFIATVCGFVFYQAFQANPVMLPEFSASLVAIPPVDQVIGIFLGNFTTGMLLLAHHAVSAALKRPMRKLVPRLAAASRTTLDRQLLVGFWVVFLVVAVPNVLFGEVVVGAFKNVLYQRAAWRETGEFSGFEVWG